LQGVHMFVCGVISYVIIDKIVYKEEDVPVTYLYIAVDFL